jgi:hypothetical protein
MDQTAILCAEVIQRVYAMPLVPEPALPDLGDLGLVVEEVVMGVDPLRGAVPFGLVVNGAAGRMLAFRGTEDWQEGVKDIEAWLEPCPLGAGANWEHGFGTLFNTLTVAGESLLTWLAETWTTGMTFTGHSLGCPLATFAALGFGAKTLVLLAPPKAGDGLLAAAVAALPGMTAVAYANPNDDVPKGPLTIKWPFLLEDFEPAVPLTMIGPGTIPADPLSSHRLDNYLALLKAA